MLDNLKQTFIVYAIIVAAIIGSAFEVYASFNKIVPAVISNVSYSQPELMTVAGTWKVQSIDTQVISKHWPNVTAAAIKEQIQLIKDLGVNYVAVDTPYDKLDELQMWSDEIHRQGLHVWFRSHWDEWEGDDGKPATLSPNDYLVSTSRFIKNNPSLFFPGDSFTVAVEPENVGVGLGKRFLTWDDYRTFLLAQVSVSNDAFSAIHLKNQIFTNWISVNGWVVDNQFTPEFAQKLGLITVDHYVGQNQTIGDYGDSTSIVQQTMTDLDRFHDKLGVPVLLGEWGYQIYQTVPDQLQADVINKMFTALSQKDYIIGVNYWTHMGNTASIIGDQYGTNLKYRSGALIIRSFYLPESLIPTTTPKSKR